MKKNKRKSIGIDISDHKISVTELTVTENKIQASGFSQIVLPFGTVREGRIKKDKQLRQILLPFFKSVYKRKAKHITAVISLPENQIYTRIFWVRNHTVENIKKRVESELRTSVSIMENDLLFFYKVYNKEKNQSLVVLTAISRTVATEWRDFFITMGIEIEYIEDKIISIYRGLFEKNPEHHLLIVNIGKAETTLAVFHNGYLLYKHASFIGSDYLVQKIVKIKKINRQEAVELIKEKGLEKSPELKEFISKSLMVLFQEIKDILFELRTKQKIMVKEINYLGEMSRISGFLKYATSFGLAPRSKLGFALYLEKVGFSYQYICAVGLARRGLFGELFQNEPHIVVPPYIKAKKIKKSKRRVIVKKKILLLALVFLLINGSFFYFFSLKRKNVFFHTTGVGEKKVEQMLGLKFFVNTNSQKKQGYVSGRIIDITIKKARFYDEAKNIAHKKALADLRDEEILLSEPINNIIKNNILVFPLYFQWIAYNKEELVELINQKIKKFDQAATIKEIKINKCEQDKDKSIYYMSGAIKLALNKNIKINNLFINAPKEEGLATIEIIGADIGLNVRSGPGTVYKKIGKVFNKERFVVIDKTDNWLKINYKKKESGWIFSKYTREIKN